jgi:hypothetical protein
MLAILVTLVLSFIGQSNAANERRYVYIPIAQGVGKPALVSDIKSVDALSQTKDTLCNQHDDAYIQQWMKLVKGVGATHITIGVPYDTPDCGEDPVAYARRWEQAARAEELHIWWRQMFTEFENIYGHPFVTQCNTPEQKHCNDYIAMTKAFIVAHKELYQPGDVFSVTAEPAASRIRGVNCFGEVCVFESASGSWNAIPEFNKFLVDGIVAAKEAFVQIGLGDKVKVNAGGLDAFVAVGYDNPDWGCDSPGKPDILYRQTVVSMGGFVLDHYFDPAGDTMKNLLDTVEGCYPPDRYSRLKFAIGEWGPIVGDNTPGQIDQTFADVRAAGPRFNGVFNYWQAGPVGGTGRITTRRFVNGLAGAVGQETLLTWNGKVLVPTPNYQVLRAEYLR